MTDDRWELDDDLNVIDPWASKAVTNLLVLHKDGLEIHFKVEGVTYAPSATENQFTSLIRIQEARLLHHNNRNINRIIGRWFNPGDEDSNSNRPGYIPQAELYMDTEIWHLQEPFCFPGSTDHDPLDYGVVPMKLSFRSRQVEKRQ
jgi:hypothetical protein